MGFDLYAVEPRTQDEKHTYFRNNVWWWRPLWQYCKVCGLITDDQFNRGQYNDGHRIPKEQAEKMGIRLLHLVEQGETKKYSENYQHWKDTLPKDDFNKHYPFDVENVEEFAKFCLNSGGFVIC